jgi:hypothetical protein
MPTGISSAAEDVIGLADSVSLDLDGDQRMVLAGALTERLDGMWAANQVGFIEPRQNGKTQTLAADALGSLYVVKLKLVMWTAHRFSTAIEAWRLMRDIVTNWDHLRRRVRGVRRTTWGGGEIELLDGNRVLFGSRSAGASGRGFSLEKLYLDEAFDLTDDDLAALLPALSARPNHQVWYASSAPKPHSEVLRRVCRAGRRGAPGMAYVEFCAADDAASDDPVAWAEANPAFPQRITDETIRGELGSMSDEDFRRERLGIWNPDLDELYRIIPTELWQSLADPEAERPETVAFALVVNRDRTRTAIGYAGRRGDGLMQVGLSDWMPGTSQAVARLVELRDRWNPVGFAVATKSESLLLDLEKAEFTVPDDPDEPQRGDLAVVGSAQDAAAYGVFVDMARGDLQGEERVDLLRHADDAPVSTALAQARTRSVAGGSAWDDKASEVAPLRAVCHALWLHEAWAHLVQADYDPLANIY